jgi:hypothetical protein
MNIDGSSAVRLALKGNYEGVLLWYIWISMWILVP